MYCFHHVCVSVCLCVCLCVRPIFWYFISRLFNRIDIDLKLMQDTYRAVLNSLQKSRSRSQGRYIAFWRYSHITKTEPEKIFNFVHRHLFDETIKTWASREMTSQKIRQYLTLTCITRIPRLLFLIKSSIKIYKNLVVRQLVSTYTSSMIWHPTSIIYQCAKFGDNRTSFKVIFDVCDV